jgi:hypothetical protein
MQKNVLNFIIAIAILGIIVGLARDYIFSNHTQKEEVTVVPTLSKPSPTPDLNPKVACNSNFFTVKKGTVWKYQLALDSPTKVNTLFTNEVIATSESSITLKTTINNEKTSSQTILQCRKNGIYGLPIPLFSSEQFAKALSLGNVTNLIKIDPSILFIPTDETFVAGGRWDSELNIKVSLLMEGPAMAIKLKNTVIPDKKEYVLNQGFLQTYEVTTIADFSSVKQFIGNPQTGIIRKIYVSKYAPHMGVVSMNLYFDFKNANVSNGTLTLLQFIP